MHPHQLTLTPDTVRKLVDHQFPQWSGLPIERVASPGTVNAIFRIGRQLAARFPLVPADVESTRRWLEREAAAARKFVWRTRFSSPEPVALGEPGAGYPMPWAVQTWVVGRVMSEFDGGQADPAASETFVRDLAELIAGTREIDTGGAQFAGSGRGGDLPAHDDWMQTCFDNSEALFDVPRVRRCWYRLRELPCSGPDLMTHGDLIPMNLLVTDGRLVGVLDVGGLGPADPALDLVVAWHLLEAGPRRALREALGCDDLEWERGKAWAFEQAMGAAWYYVESNPAMSLMGKRTIDRILADECVSQR